MKRKTARDEWQAMLREAGGAVTRLYENRARFVEAGASRDAWRAMAVALDAIRVLGALEPDPQAVDRIRRMYGVIDGRPRERERSLDLSLVETYVGMGRRGARPWEECAALLGRSFGVPAASLPKLAHMLESHHVARGSGRAPRGRFTTAMIAEWLTGDHASAKHASRARKSDK